MIYFQVADLYFSFDERLIILSERLNYQPFRVKKDKIDDNYLFNLEINTTLKSDASNCKFTYTNEIGYYGVTYANQNYEWILKELNADRYYVMHLDIESRKAILNFEITDDFTMQAADDFVRFAFIYSAAFHDTVLLHASCIKYFDKGIAFMGRSGIGKSTHSTNWLNYIEGSELLNDDQPAVRIVNNNAIIYGTPWSGKTICYKKKKVVLYAILCMEQQPFNKLVPINNMVLFTHLLSACSLIRTEKRTLKEILHTLAELSIVVKGAILQNKPNKEAVILAYQFLNEE